MKKICLTCQRELSEEEYTGKRNVCKRCTSFQRNRTRSSSPEAYLTIVCAKLKSARKNMEWELDMEHIKSLWQQQLGRCALSGVFMTWHAGEGKQDLNVSIDRKDPNKGYIIGNIQLVAQRVNTMKHTLGDSEFYWWCKNIAYNKERKA